MLLAQLGTGGVDTVQFGPGLVRQLLAGRDRGADRAGEDAGVGLGRAGAREARVAWLTAAALVVVAGVAVGLGAPVGPGAVVAITLIGCCAWAAGGDDPVSVIATAPAAVIAATAATRTAIQGHNPHSALRAVPVDLSPEASLPALILRERAGASSGSRLANGGWRSPAA